MVAVQRMTRQYARIYYRCLVCCFLRRRTSSSAALMAGLGAHWARQISLARLFPFPSEKILHRRTNKNTYFTRWMNITPRATDRRVFRRRLCEDGPGIGDVILAIIARICSSLPREIRKSSEYSLPRQKKVLPNTHLRSRRLKRTKRYRFW